MYTETSYITGYISIKNFSNTSFLMGTLYVSS